MVKSLQELSIIYVKSLITDYDIIKLDVPKTLIQRLRECIDCKNTREAMSRCHLDCYLKFTSNIYANIYTWR